MNEIDAFDKVLWGLNVCLQARLLVLLLNRKNHRIFPFLFVYLLIAFLQNVVTMASYRIWAFSSSNAVRIAWGTQGLVILGRALAVAEISRRVLAGSATSTSCVCGRRRRGFPRAWRVARASWCFEPTKQRG